MCTQQQANGMGESSKQCTCTAQNSDKTPASESEESNSAPVFTPKLSHRFLGTAQSHRATCDCWLCCGFWVQQGGLSQRGTNYLLNSKLIDTLLTTWAIINLSVVTITDKFCLLPQQSSEKKLYLSLQEVVTRAAYPFVMKVIP